MNGEISTASDETVDTGTLESFQSVETATLRPVRSVRIMVIAFAFCCYITFAALYFFRPTNPVVSLGQARFTIDALLELVFSILALPAFGVTYVYGIKHHEVNPDFPVPDVLIDFLLMAAMVWVAVGNGIHLTAKLDEQMVAALNDGPVVGLRANFHFIRQEVGHVFPHIGWQLLFAALMLGQLKRPYWGAKSKSAVSFFGTLLGLLFAQGAVAGSCTHVGFVLMAVSCAVFAYLGYKSKLHPGELPILNFFFCTQVTFLLAMIIYWGFFHGALI